MEIATWWPTWALILKRLHDFEHGWKTLLLFVASDIATTVVDCWTRMSFQRSSSFSLSGSH
jgi:uncharacterized membrane protein YhaH (DUF805 family)